MSAPASAAVSTLRTAPRLKTVKLSFRGQFDSQKVQTADYRPLSLLLYNQSVYDLNNS